jgi:hypothetical protein
MQIKLIATITQTRDRTPLASIRNMPGNDAEFTPDQLRDFARVLNLIADDSEAMPMKAKYFTPRNREYDLAV